MPGLLQDMWKDVREYETNRRNDNQRLWELSIFLYSFILFETAGTWIDYLCCLQDEDYIG